MQTSVDAPAQQGTEALRISSKGFNMRIRTTVATLVAVGAFAMTPAVLGGATASAQTTHHAQIISSAPTAATVSDPAQTAGAWKTVGVYPFKWQCRVNGKAQKLALRAKDYRCKRTSFGVTYKLQLRW